MKDRLEYFVYAIFVEAPEGTLVKIGRGASVRERVSGVRTGCPYPIVRVYSVDVENEANGVICEKEAHELHRQRRLCGEWFSPWGRSATDIEQGTLEGDLWDIATATIGHSPSRTFAHSPTPYQHRKVQMTETPLLVDEKKFIRDPEGFPIVAPFRVGVGTQPVKVEFKRRRFQRH